MLKIDLYTEITCPWCIIGHHRLDKVLAGRFPELDVVYVSIQTFCFPTRQRRASTFPIFSSRATA